MNVVLVLALVVGSCVCGVQPQHTQYQHHSRKTLRNPTLHVKEKGTQVLAVRENLETKGKEATLVNVDKSEIKEGTTRSLQEVDRRCHYIQRNTEATIIDMNKKYPNRGKLKTLPGLMRLKQEGTQEVNTTISIQRKDCAFICPQAESLTPCSCDPCTRTVNCSAVESFEQLFGIFHTTIFPNPSFESFLLVSPLRKSHKGTIRSNIFLANTFGDASFTSIWVESMASLTEVEAGAFRGSEATLKSLVFRWNYGLTNFPFKEIENMEVLQKLELSGSSFTSLPAFPHNPRLTTLFLDDNLIHTIPTKTFAELPSLMYLDLAFNSLHDLKEGSLHFSSQDVMLFLDHNAIQYINEHTFSGQQPSLLDISCNALTGLDQRVFQPILDNIIDHEYDSYVDAICNPLQCPSISWLLQDPQYLYYVALPDPPCFPAS